MTLDEHKGPKAYCSKCEKVVPYAELCKMDLSWRSNPKYEGLKTGDWLHSTGDCCGKIIWGRKFVQIIAGDGVWTDFSMFALSSDGVIWGRDSDDDCWVKYSETPQPWEEA